MQPWACFTDQHELNSEGIRKPASPPCGRCLSRQTYVHRADQGSLRINDESRRNMLLYREVDPSIIPSRQKIESSHSHDPRYGAPKMVSIRRKSISAGSKRGPYLQKLLSALGS